MARVLFSNQSKLCMTLIFMPLVYFPTKISAEVWLVMWLLRCMYQIALIAVDVVSHSARLCHVVTHHGTWVIDSA